MSKRARVVPGNAGFDPSGQFFIAQYDLNDISDGSDAVATAEIKLDTSKHGRNITQLLEKSRSILATRLYQLYESARDSDFPMFISDL